VPTKNHVGHQPAAPFVFHAPAIGDENYLQAPAIYDVEEPNDVEQHELPVMDDIEADILK
jgi:hypothetical protein